MDIHISYNTKYEGKEFFSVKRRKIYVCLCTQNPNFFTKIGILLKVPICVVTGNIHNIWTVYIFHVT